MKVKINSFGIKDGKIIHLRDDFVGVHDFMELDPRESVDLIRSPSSATLHVMPRSA